MTDVSVQFHALPSEISDLVSNLVNDPDLFMVEAAGSPLQFVQHSGPRVGLEECPARRALLFTLDRPVLSGYTLYDFRLRNPDALVLETGQLSELGLAECWLSARTENEIAATRWKRASKAIRRATLHGAEAVNRE